MYLNVNQQTPPLRAVFVDLRSSPVSPLLDQIDKNDYNIIGVSEYQID